MTKPNFREYVLGALPGTKVHLEARSGVSRSAVLKWVRLMHDAREIYIAGWLPHPLGGPAMAIYALGNLPDAPCTLKKLTKQEIRQRFEKKAKADGRWDSMRAKWRSVYWRRKAATERDPLVAAMFGAPAAQGARRA
jgi:hypothetical protein